MTPAAFLYKTVSNLSLFLMPVARIYSGITGKFRGSIDQRFGIYPADFKFSNRFPRIWMHAASVGEVGVAVSIYRELIRLVPECDVVVSTTTETGHSIAAAGFPEPVRLIFAPVDLVLAVKRALGFIKPDVLVFVETEIWPNWAAEAYNKGVKIVLVNGRISRRSFRKYLKIKPLIQETLQKFSCLSMIHPDDADRIECMGAPRDKTVVHGNAKFDGLHLQDESAIRSSMRRIYSLNPDDIVLVAGSTRQNEEEVILRAYRELMKTHPGLLLFIAPRHIERSSAIGEMAESMGLDVQFRSAFEKTGPRSASVVIIDIMGELASVYGIGTLAFCGGSLVPLGGQNILEAAAWGIPVFYGPYMEDFQEARNLIEEAVGAAFLVRSGDEMIRKATAYLENPKAGAVDGEGARSAVIRNSGAAEKHARVIYDALTQSIGSQCKTI